MSEYPRTVQAVKELLKLDRFIDSQKDVIFRKLEDHYAHVRDEAEAPLLFIAEALPLVSGSSRWAAPSRIFGRRFVGRRPACPAPTPVLS
jgi:hypothetical protein